MRGKRKWQKRSIYYYVMKRRDMHFGFSSLRHERRWITKQQEEEDQDANEEDTENKIGKKCS